MVADVQETLTNKNSCIAAKKISQKCKKMRNKRAPSPFNLARLADADRVVYANDTNLGMFPQVKAQILQPKNIAKI